MKRSRDNKEEVHLLIFIRRQYMKNCIVAQSGGPTVAINASLSGVIRGALESDKN